MRRRRGDDASRDPPGATLRVAADSLHRAGVIGPTRLFRLYASISGHDRRIRAGTYVMSRGMSWPAVVSALTQGTGLIRTVTIPEGYAIADIAPLLARTLGVEQDSVLAATRDSAMRERLDVPTPTLEGYLFPDTYSFPDGTTGARGGRDDGPALRAGLGAGVERQAPADGAVPSRRR